MMPARCATYPASDAGLARLANATLAQPATARCSSATSCGILRRRFDDLLANDADLNVGYRRGS